MATNPDDAVTQQLLLRYLQSGDLTVQELSILVHAFWREGDLLTDALPRALEEPPDSPTPAPMLMIRILLNLREQILAKSDRSPHDTETLNDARERLALTIASADTEARKVRLLQAFNALQGGSVFDDIRRPVSLRLVAELGYRLITEFQETNRAELIELVAIAFERLADAEIGLRELALSYEVRLRGLALVRKHTPSDFATEWTRLQEKAAVALAAEKPTQGPAAWRVVARRAILSTVANDTDLDCDVREAIDHWHATYDNWYTGDRKVAARGLEQLTLGVLGLLRMRAALGIGGICRGHTALFELLRSLRAYHYVEAEKQRIYLAAGGISGPEDAKSLGPALRAINAKLDESMLRGQVHELLSEGGAARRGLAMSGGGFRAAFFHLGVLAWLAESDQLRKLDVISCVSGGSITGACFAIRLRTLLLEKPDLDVRREDYLQIVQEIIERISSVARRNLRMRAFASPSAVLRIWLQPGYTFTERIAELLDRDLFAPMHPYASKLSGRELREKTRSKAEMTRPGRLGAWLAMTGAKQLRGWPMGPWDLHYTPRGESEAFFSVAGNALRRAKVPEIVFNATTVNTGNAFRFTADAHGERTYPDANRISRRPRLTWLSYGDYSAAVMFKPTLLPLSRAVAASASVPGIIPPLLVARSTKDILIALADGGVVDNQGIDHLLDRRCTDILISDASGQLKYQPYPDVTNISTVARSSDILMERVRELNYERLERAESSGALEWKYLHLTKELTTPPPRMSFRPDSVIANQLYELAPEQSTSYGVSMVIQELLAEMRTDLDCFSSAESETLMLSGYLQAQQERPEVGTPSSNYDFPWSFLEMREAARPGTAGNHRLTMLLQAARFRFLRLPRISAALLTGAPEFGEVFVAVLGILALTLVAWAFVRVPADSKVVNAILLCVIVGGMLVVKFPPSAAKRRAVKLAVGPLLIVGMLWAWADLVVNDWLYLRLSRKILTFGGDFRSGGSKGANQPGPET